MYTIVEGLRRLRLEGSACQEGGAAFVNLRQAKSVEACRRRVVCWVCRRDAGAPEISARRGDAEPSAPWRGRTPRRSYESCDSYRSYHTNSKRGSGISGISGEKSHSFCSRNRGKYAASQYLQCDLFRRLGIGRLHRQPRLKSQVKRPTP